jgi:hypothetical protein
VRVTEIVVLTLALIGSGRVSYGAAQQAQNGAAAVRGSWVTEGTGARYMYIFAVQDDRISGLCAHDASISTTLRLYRMAASRGMRSHSLCSMIGETQSPTGRRFVERLSGSA